MIKLTLKQLADFDGKNGNRAYIAYKGRIYDVTDSFLWKGGKHFVRHFAGLDLTEELKDAPHGDDMLQRVPEIGILVDERT